jgi:hypothetical protein
MKKNYKVPSAEIQHLLKTVYDDCMKEDDAVRNRQIRAWRKLKLLWEGYQRVWYSEVAHDWRIWDIAEQSDSDQGAYDKPSNILKAYLESIIAALSVSIPAIKCYPDDADNTLDQATARAGDKIAELVYRHNDAALLWLHGLFIYATEGMTAYYNYVDTDEKYGTYQSKQYDDVTEEHAISNCPSCNYQLNDEVINPDNAPRPPDISNGSGGIPSSPMANPAMGDQSNPVLNSNSGQPPPDTDDEFDPSLDLCPACGQMMSPQVTQETFIVNRLIGITDEPKSRICLNVYGGLYVKVPNYAKSQKDIPYLIKSEERDYSLVCEEYDHLHGNDTLLESIKTGRNTPGAYEQYAMWGRLSPQYSGEYPLNVVTENIAWIRPAKFNILPKESADKLKKKYPHGVRVVYINEEFATACDECLDDHWTLLANPLSDYIHFTPLGESLTSVQEITNDLISLILQTVEHGIGQTFADPSVLDFKSYAQTEVTPGGIFPTKSVGGKKINEGFYELKTATLSGEVLPFYQQMQSMGQLVSGALPSLFGGAVEGSETASQYSMSRAQALQRLQNTWKMFTIAWKNLFGKVVPAYIKEVKDDERDVQRTKDGNFVNVFIRKAELEGKIGKVELEASENLPMTWGQIKDTYEKLLLNQNPLVQQMLTQPENISVIQDALGLPNLFVPGEQDVENQYEEIKLLLNATPIPTGDPQLSEVPSVEIEPDFDNHKIHFEICRKWIISEAGRQAKVDNPEGYKNVLLHAKAHLSIMQQQEMQAAQMQGAAPGAKPNPNEVKDAPITENSDVQTV